MKCQVSSNTTHDVLISDKIGFKSYKSICSGEKKKVNLGYNEELYVLKVENNKLIAHPDQLYIFGLAAGMAETWEVFFKFFSTHNIEQNWLDCNYTWGWFDEELGGWTGCMGKVGGTM